MNLKEYLIKNGIEHAKLSNYTDGGFYAWLEKNGKVSVAHGKTEIEAIENAIKEFENEKKNKATNDCG